MTRLVVFFMGMGGDPQRKDLKILARHLQREGLKYYNINTEKVLPDYAALLYAVYETVAPLRNFFLNRNEDAYYAAELFHYYRTEEQERLLAQLSADSLVPQAANMPYSDLKAHIEKTLSEMREEFSPEIEGRITSLYTAVMALKQFCVIDYYALLKKFFPALKENNFHQSLSFHAVERERVMQELTDFIAAACALLTIRDLSPVLTFLKHLPSYREVSLQDMQDMCAKLKAIQDKDGFACMARLVQHDARFQIPVTLVEKDLVTPYMEKLRQSVDEVLAELFTKKKGEQITLLAKKVFASSTLPSLKNYTPEFSKILGGLSIKELDSCEEVHYLYAYIELFFKTRVKEFMEVFAMRAISPDKKYVASLADAVHDIIDHASMLTKLDSQLNSNFQQGYKLKNYIDKIDENPRNKDEADKLIEGVNEEAFRLVYQIMKQIHFLSDNLQRLFEECKEGDNQMVTNWEEVDRFLKMPSVDMLSSIMATMNNFIELMDYYN